MTPVVFFLGLPFPGDTEKRKHTFPMGPMGQTQRRMFRSNPGGSTPSHIPPWAMRLQTIMPATLGFFGEQEMGPTSRPSPKQKTLPIGRIAESFYMDHLKKPFVVWSWSWNTREISKEIELPHHSSSQRSVQTTPAQPPP